MLYKPQLESLIKARHTDHFLRLLFYIVEDPYCERQYNIDVFDLLCKK